MQASKEYDLPAIEYRLAAEWEPHAATWLAWPHRKATWLGDFAPIPKVFEKVARLLAAYEPVRMIASGSVLEEARSSIGSVSNIELVDIPTNDAWLRDTGPVFLLPPDGQEPLAVAWKWNAWGGKYPPWDADAKVACAIARRLQMNVVEPDVVLEGGAIETDGEGTLLVNYRCIEDPSRNPDLSRTYLERVMREHLAIEKVLWVGGELVGDDTDGHIDQLARFVSPGRVVVARQPDSLDSNHAALEANCALFSTLVDARGRQLEIIPIDIPSRFVFEGVQLPASFMNFYIANGIVVVPIFRDKADDAALRQFEQCFPGRRIIPFDCYELIRGRGALHCITRDEPARQA